jgi:hypothetical protein
MMMCYHWGLGVGHTYTYQTTMSLTITESHNEVEEEICNDDEQGEPDVIHGRGQCPSQSDDESSYEDWHGSEGSDSEDTDDLRYGTSDDGELDAMEDMYPFGLE